MPSRRKTETAIRELLRSWGVAATGDLQKTPKRVAALWHDQLLSGQDVDLAALLRGGTVCRSCDPVSLLDVDVHLVCPHHLTVAFGQAHLGYVPGGRVASFGRLSDLIHACTSRLILQEQASTLIVESMIEHLGATAAVCVIEARHPCHNLTKPRAHRARALTWAASGPRAQTRELRAGLMAAIRPR